MLIKVCGMRDPQNASQVGALSGLSMMGFIFYPPSPRFVGDATPQTPAGIQRVGVFVNASTEEIMERVARHSLDVVQLHGSESVAQCEALRSEGVEVIKAISVSDRDDVARAAEYEGSVDYLLFDTKCKDYGGSGVRFDWSILDEYRGKTPFLLSGGIDESVAADIATLSHAAFAGVDLNSRFELSPAQKDVERIANFIDEILKK